MSNHFCGFDFGTTNSAIGVGLSTGELTLVPLEGDATIIPSAIFFDYDSSRFFYGQNAKDRFLRGEEGRLMMSLKSILGTDTVDMTTKINGFDFNFYEIIGYVFRNIKEKAERLRGAEITQTVLGRPVFFNEIEPEKDRKAQRILEEAARQQGIRDVEFQYEPIAAALEYETRIYREQIALIVDIGGGTSDFSVIRLTPNNRKADRAADILSRMGMRVGGNRFDTLISVKKVMTHLGKDVTYKSTTGEDLPMPISSYFAFSTWHRINSMYTREEISFLQNILPTTSDPHLIERFIYALTYEMGHQLIGQVEATKINLSRSEHISTRFSIMQEGFDVEISRQRLSEIIEEEALQIREMVAESINMAGVEPNSIDTLFFTGGSTKIKFLRDLILELVPQAEIVEGDAFGSVAMGLTIDAHNRFC